jgi:hypothetical protein
MRILDCFLVFTILLSLSCKTNYREKVKTLPASDTVSVPDQYFTNLFIRNCCGMTGADGTYSVLLPDGRTVWIFGDTFLGTVNPDKTRKKLIPKFIRNAFAVQDGDSLNTLHQKTPTGNASMVIPPPPGQEKESLPEDSVWFWPGDGLIEDGKLKVFMSEFIQLDTGMWSFQWRGTWMASFILPEIRQDSLYRIPYSQVNQVHYGHAVLEDEAYTYVYGSKDGRPHAARYAKGNVDSPWEFYGGTDWTNDPKLSKPMSEIHASEQFSVLKIKDKYVYITQMEYFSLDICAFTSDKPNGPFDNKSLLYTTPIPGNDTNLITYNAVAHPQFIEDNRLLVSYNMNSFVEEDHFRNADIYRPRFIRVPLKLIDPEF